MILITNEIKLTLTMYVIVLVVFIFRAYQRITLLEKAYWRCLCVQYLKYLKNKTIKDHLDK